MTNRHLGALLLALFVCMGVGVALGFHALSHETHARTIAVCHSENETRKGIRDFLHEEFKITPQQSPRQQDELRAFLKVTDERFAPKDCNHIVNH